MKHKKFIIAMLLFIILFTTGCWDKIETSNRGFIASILFDANENTGSEQAGSPVFCDEREKKIRVSFGMINPSKLKGGEKAFIPRSINAADFADAVEGLASASSRRPFFGHTTLLVFTDKFTKNDTLFRDALDELERNPIINRQMKIVLYKGEANEIYKIEPKLENLIAEYVSGIMENSSILSNTLDMDLGKFLTILRNGEGRAVMPLLKMKEGGKGDIEINGIALINKYKLLKIVEPKYIKSYKILTGSFVNGRKIVDYNEFTVPYYITSSKRRIELKSSGDKLNYTVKIKMEGDIQEFSFDKEIYETQVVNDLKKIIEESLKKEIEETVKYFQEDIGLDYLGLGEYTRKYHNKIYKKYEGNWDQAFKNAQVNIEVEADIRRLGATKK